MPRTPARKTDQPDLYMANQSFSTTVDGEIIGVNKGDLVRAGHKILRGRMEFFEPAVGYVKFDVEQATGAPGEKRP